MQVDPLKLKLKPPGTKRLKPKCDILLSTPAFKFELRRYNVGALQKEFDTRTRVFEDDADFIVEVKVGCWVLLLQTRVQETDAIACIIKPQAVALPPVYAR